MSDTPLRRCTACENEFPATTDFFHRQPRGEYGLKAECKACMNKRNRLYKKRPEVQEYLPNYYKDYYSRPEIRVRQKDYYKVYHKDYYSRPKAKEQQIIKDGQRRARKLAVAGTHTASQIQKLLKRQKHKCYYCSTRFQQVKGKYVYHIDHTFPLSRIAGTTIPANDISYLVLACLTCNLSKHDKFPWEFPEGGRLL